MCLTYCQKLTTEDTEKRFKYKKVTIKSLTSPLGALRVVVFYAVH